MILQQNFTTEMLDKQAAEFIELKKRLETYPLRENKTAPVLHGNGLFRRVSLSSMESDSDATDFGCWIIQVHLIDDT